MDLEKYFEENKENIQESRKNSKSKIVCNNQEISISNDCRYNAYYIMHFFLLNFILYNPRCSYFRDAISRHLCSDFCQNEGGNDSCTTILRAPQSFVYSPIIFFR